jgi:hypothetical protein
VTTLPALKQFVCGLTSYLPEVDDLTRENWIYMETFRPDRGVRSSYLEKAMTYDVYKKWLDNLVLLGKTSGPNQSEAFVHYTRMNQQRMSRLDKTIEVGDGIKEKMLAIGKAQTWLVLTEAWCGDAAQSLPVMQALAKVNPRIDLRLLLRDENPELMDQYLTNGTSRSIPKLIAMDTNTLKELFTWGPRPFPLQELFMHMKTDGLAFDVVKEELQRWYNKDRTLQIQEEIAALATGG